DARFRAERSIREAMVSKEFDDLAESPRLGFAIIGRLCQAYGFQISLRRSAYGGVRAVLVVPKAMLTTAPPTGRAHGIGAFSGPRPLPPNRPRHAAPSRPWGARTTPAGVGPSNGSTNPWGPSGPAGDDEVIVTEWTANGLPQRRRSQPLVPRTYRGATRTAAQHTGPTAGPLAQTSRPAKERKEPGLWVEAFMRGIKGTGPSPSGPGAAADDDHGTGTRRATDTGRTADPGRTTDTGRATGTGQPGAGHTSAAHTSEETAGKGEQ
ncbi:ATP-binding protein, partial [Kitasatospora sp. NPDC056783]